jgi:hypothetical protein
METKRLDLSAILANRDSSISKDGLLVNAYLENTPLGKMIQKRPGLLSTWNAGLGCAEGAITYNGKALVVVGGSWGTTTQAPPTYSPGTSWSLFVASPNMPATNSSVATNNNPSLASVSGRLLSIGNTSTFGTGQNVYASDDNGSTWSSIASSVTGPQGSLLNTVNLTATIGTSVYIYLVGTSPGVWKSIDSGVTWTNVASVTLGGGSNPSAWVVHSDDKIYSFSANVVESSPDGVTWTTVNNTALWLGRSFFAAWSLGANLYIGAGFTASALNDVWKSTDNGVTWTQIQASAAFSARGAVAFWTYNSKLWIAIGATASNLVSSFSDLWSSADGITWTLVNSSMVGASYGFASHVVHNNTMYIGSGRYFNSGTKYLRESFFAAGATNPSVGTITMTPFSPTVTSCEPFSFTLIPASGSVPVKVFLKTSLYAWVYDGTTMTQVTDGDYPALTVPGVVYLDGTIYVMNSQGVIFGSDLNDPTSWNALNFITANAEADAAIVLARQLNYIVAFKQYSTEFFYDAGNSPGSPLGKVQNALLEIGCSSSGSLAFADNTIYFMANSRQKGRSIMKLEGYTPKLISNPYVDRILNGDNLSSVFAFVVKSNGHFFYVLTLVNSAITLVYDEVTSEWHTWTTMTAASPASVSSAVVQSDGSILITMSSAHGQSDGNPVVIAGATPSAVNGSFNLRYDSTVNSTSQFSYYPASTVTGSITGTITAVFYTETFFPGVYYAYGDGVDYLVDRTTGAVYTFSPSTYQDKTYPIDVKIRTAILDFGVMFSKRYSRLELVGDKEVTNVLVRFTDDDYQTYSLYRGIPMSQNRAKISSLGSARRRAFEFRNTGNTALRLLAAEIDIDVGAF